MKKNGLNFKGHYQVVIERKDGTVEIEEFDNVVTLEGEDYLLKAGVTGDVSPITQWFVGLIGANVNPAKNDTASTALGSSGSYGEITTYDEANRPVFQGAYDASSHEVSNTASVAVFTINSSCTAYGAFITNNSGKNDNTGILLSAGLFSNPKTLGAGDKISVNYVIQSQ